MFQTEFFSYLQLGFTHIADIQGYDHILFVVALAAMYDWRDWKRLLWLITAFTIGHSITLALSTLNIIAFSSSIVEFLIPVTVFLTACANIFSLRMGSPTNAQTLVQERGKYLVALCFGFIHGMGFSTFLKSLLGKESAITLPLFAFNIGLEMGQILIVACVLAQTFLITRSLVLARRDWMLVLSGATLGIALTLMAKNNPFGG